MDFNTCSFVDFQHLQGQGPLWVDPEGTILFFRKAASSLPRMKPYQLTRYSVLTMPDPADACGVLAFQSNVLREEQSDLVGVIPFNQAPSVHQAQFQVLEVEPHGACSLAGQRGKHKSNKQTQSSGA